jgi:hypothetical protein
VENPGLRSDLHCIPMAAASFFMAFRCCRLTPNRYSGLRPRLGIPMAAAEAFFFMAFRCILRLSRCLGLVIENLHFTTKLQRNLNHPLSEIPKFWLAAVSRRTNLLELLHVVLGLSRYDELSKCQFYPWL